MSYFDASEARCDEGSGNAELVIEPKARDLGGLSVRRVLPAVSRRAVGPFVFFDHMGPADFPPGAGIQVRPHPHIGLATLTYLFDGEIIHRDSLGYVQPIRPGAANLMTAGRGIVHSERAGDDLATTSRLHGIQTWLALPEDQQERDPAFVHYPADQLPELAVEGTSVRLVMGQAFGEQSPVTPHSPTLYLELRMPAGEALSLPVEYDEVAAYVVSGSLEIGQRAFDAATMIVPGPTRTLRLKALEDTRVIVVGGKPLGRRRMWWNFVSTSMARIEEAKIQWQEGGFPAVPDEGEYIPLPDS